MSEFRYKAFISYSHEDASWGAWLQKALERYRVPRRLVGAPGPFGAIPRRLAPVFRDREDLSSASDLSSQVKDSLGSSETLVVICSPAAARSGWVNEEIRHFIELGREDRIFALIVAGDPQAQDPDLRCFPTALTEGRDGTPREPLAADARKWADGRLLAKLKLIAGILGIPLDSLRRRDMQRRQRVWMASMAGVFAVALAMGVLAVLAINARNAAENRREHAEELVGYMVGDLKKNLDEVGRLDILEGMGDEVSAYLKTLDPGEVTVESLKQQAQVWRQLGEVSMNQGKLDHAMQSFTRSRDVVAELYRRDPDNPDWLYQLGNAEFWIGYVDVESGDYEKAESAFTLYMDYATKLSALDPKNPEWLMEKSYAHGNLAALVVREDSDDVETALEHIRAGVAISAQVVALDPDNKTYLSEHGESLAWLADTLMLVCDLGGALQARQQNVEIAKQLMRASPANANLKSRYAYSLTGLAFVEQQVGLTESAVDHQNESKRILQQLAEADPTNVEYQWGALRHEHYLSVLQAESGEEEQALDRMRALYEPLDRLRHSGDQRSARRVEEWILYLLNYSDIARRAGNESLAHDLLEQAIGEISGMAGDPDALEANRNELLLARFYDWQQTGEDLWSREGFDNIRVSLEPGNRSCGHIANRVRQALVDGDRSLATGLASHLLSRGYFDPGFARICRRYGICSVPQTAPGRN
ncbi:MAG: TIR domain-containing protein [Lysobacterales bacterium]